MFPDLRRRSFISGGYSGITLKNISSEKTPSGSDNSIVGHKDGPLRDMFELYLGSYELFLTPLILYVNYICKIFVDNLE